MRQEGERAKKIRSEKNMGEGAIFDAAPSGFQ